MSTFKRASVAFASAALVLGFAWASPASAESVKKQCSEQYQAAKKANTLNGQKWNDFYKQCTAQLKGASPAAAPAAAAPAAAAPAPAPAPAAAAPAARSHKPAAAAAGPAPTVTGPIVYPKQIDPKFASLSAGKGRFKTCVAQYDANKATNSNGGLKWIEKGGGYYSMCNKHLKGE